MASDLVGLDKGGLLFMNYNDQFRQYRKHFHRLFGSKDNISKFYSIEVEETRQFLSNVLRKPEELAQHIRS